MPFAKQEYPNKKQPIEAEASIYSVDTQTGDLKFEVKGKALSVRTLINEFDRYSVASAERILFSVTSGRISNAPPNNGMHPTANSVAFIRKT